MKRKLRYQGNKLYDSPEISGSIDSYKVKIFTSEHAARDARGVRKLTTIEVSLLTYLPLGAAVASGGMVSLVDELTQLTKEFRPQVTGWDDSYIVRSRDNGVVEAFLTPERLAGIVDLMKIKNAWIILIYAMEEGLLRIDTPDPLEDPKKLDALVRQMIDVAHILELKKGEDKTLLRARTQLEDGAPKVLDIDDKVLEQGLGLELEDE
ncbi:MAG: hypothetical protein KDI13_02055 [Alphaproteobacteria bacterium]|nr:hypothetical protein [Alphaproteobacteria bacterium]